MSAGLDPEAAGCTRQHKHSRHKSLGWGAWVSRCGVVASGLSTVSEVGRSRTTGCGVHEPGQQAQVVRVRGPGSARGVLWRVAYKGAQGS